MNYRTRRLLASAAFIMVVINTTIGCKVRHTNSALRNNASNLQRSSINNVENVEEAARRVIAAADDVLVASGGRARTPSAGSFALAEISDRNAGVTVGESLNAFLNLRDAIENTSAAKERGLGLNDEADLKRMAAEIDRLNGELAVLMQLVKEDENKAALDAKELRKRLEEYELNRSSENSPKRPLATLANDPAPSSIGVAFDEARKAALKEAMKKTPSSEETVVIFANPGNPSKMRDRAQLIYREFLGFPSAEYGGMFTGIKPAGKENLAFEVTGRGDKGSLGKRVALALSIKGQAASAKAIHAAANSEMGIAFFTLDEFKALNGPNLFVAQLQSTSDDPECKRLVEPARRFAAWQEGTPIAFQGMGDDGDREYSMVHIDPSKFRGYQRIQYFECSLRLKSYVYFTGNNGPSFDGWDKAPPK